MASSGDDASHNPAPSSRRLIRPSPRSCTSSSRRKRTPSTRSPRRTSSTSTVAVQVRGRKELPSYSGGVDVKEGHVCARVQTVRHRLVSTAHSCTCTDATPAPCSRLRACTQAGAHGQGCKHNSVRCMFPFLTAGGPFVHSAYARICTHVHTCIHMRTHTRAQRHSLCLPLHGSRPVPLYSKCCKHSMPVWIPANHMRVCLLRGPPVPVQTCLCVRVCACACACVPVQTCLCVRVCACASACVLVHACVCACVRVCVLCVHLGWAHACHEAAQCSASICVHLSVPRKVFAVCAPLSASQSVCCVCTCWWGACLQRSRLRTCRCWGLQRSMWSTIAWAASSVGRWAVDLAQSSHLLEPWSVSDPMLAQAASRAAAPGLCNTAWRWQKTRSPWLCSALSALRRLGLPTPCTHARTHTPTWHWRRVQRAHPRASGSCQGYSACTHVRIALAQGAA